MPGTPGSQGTLGHYNLKKQKSLKQNETISEAATAALVSASQANQQMPSVPSSKLLKQNSIRDRNRRVRVNKVRTVFRVIWSYYYHFGMLSSGLIRFFSTKNLILKVSGKHFPHLASESEQTFNWNLVF